MLSKLAKTHKAYKSVEPLTRHYLDIYERHFDSIREDVGNVLEIGVQGGGSVRMWADYFPNAVIDGVDISPKCLSVSTDRINIHIGDQSDRGFLSGLGSYDIIIDDGGHTMGQQQASLSELWDGHLSDGGIYVIEDLTTSYWPKFGDGSTIERLKSLVDVLNRDAIGHKRAEDRRQDVPDVFLKSIHFYPAMCFMYRK